MRERTLKRILCVILSGMLLLTGTAGCARRTSGDAPAEPISATAVLLDTVVSITLYDSSDESLLEGCMDLIKHYEELFSRTIATSDIARLNSGETDTVSPETAELILQGLMYGDISEGRFDITIGAVSSLWDFSSGGGSVPPAGLIAEALTHVDYSGVRVEGTRVTFEDPETMLDLGAIAKGFIADRLKEYLVSNGVGSAVINLGGNTMCIGEKPGGKPFRIGIQYPFKETGELIAVLEISDMSVVSSGSYERYFVSGGVSYHHILDPSTGYSVSSGLCAVTIICSSSMQADALSTICFILGEKDALSLIDALDGVWCILIRDDMSMVFSEGAEAFVSK